ncbi:hypothetical protein N9N67_00955 [Bacteriovoracaceae bacterium]|nr:hypothetical protein [Bacteriovoracaceae bacterium]
MKIVLGLMFTLLTSLNAQTIEEKCKLFEDKVQFEKNLGTTNCGNSITLLAWTSSEVVEGNKCKITVKLEEMWTEMQCPERLEDKQRARIFATFKRPFVNRKFNRLCKIINFQRIQKGKDKYGDRYIVCSKRLKE